MYPYTRSTLTKPTAAEGSLYKIYLPNDFQMVKSPVRSRWFLKDYSAQNNISGRHIKIQKWADFKSFNPSTVSPKCLKYE